VGNGRGDWLHVFSCYVASRENKEEFYDILQQALSGVPSKGVYVVLGDFNAHVGSRGTVMSDKMRGSLLG
jgi:hypothetical protein